MTQPSREFEIGMAALAVHPASWWKEWLNAIRFDPYPNKFLDWALERNENIIRLREELRRREGRQ